MPMLASPRLRLILEWVLAMVFIAPLVFLIRPNRWDGPSVAFYATFVVFAVVGPSLKPLARYRRSTARPIVELDFLADMDYLRFLTGWRRADSDQAGERALQVLPRR